VDRSDRKTRKKMKEATGYLKERSGTLIRRRKL